MSNSFNISVAPDIAAAVVKIDANKTAIDAVKADTGPIRNDVTAIHDTNLPAVKADTGPIRNDVTAIHDTMLPSVKLDTAALRNDMTDIHDTELPAIKIQTTSILNRANAIKAKTDAIPQNVRGTFLKAHLDTTNAALQTVLSVSGHGKLLILGCRCQNTNDTVEIKLTVDGLAYNVITHTGDVIDQSIISTIGDARMDIAYLLKIPYPESASCLTNIEFSTSLLVQSRRSAGSTSPVSCKVYYSSDGF